MAAVNVFFILGSDCFIYLNPQLPLSWLISYLKGEPLRLKNSSFRWMIQLSTLEDSKIECPVDMFTTVFEVFESACITEGIDLESKAQWGIFSKKEKHAEPLFLDFNACPFTPWEKEVEFIFGKQLDVLVPDSSKTKEKSKIYQTLGYDPVVLEISS